MKSFNGLVICENGIISTLFSTGPSVNIISSGKDYYYENAYAYPGLMDGHGHVIGLGLKLKLPDFSVCKTAYECAVTAQSPACKRGDWIYAFGWNQENWHNPVFPDKSVLDDLFPANPVCLIRQDGHCAWVNSKALQILGFNSLTNNPQGGEIVKDSNGEPTGILIDNAMNKLMKAIGDYNKQQLKELFSAACYDLAAKGVTEICDMDVEPIHLAIYTELEGEGRLPIRIQAYVKAQNDEWSNSELYPFQTKMFNLRGVKYYLDGAIGSRGASFKAPYSDAPETSGLELISVDEFYEKARKAAMSGFDIAVHAIGDKAVSQALEVFKRIRENPAIKESISLRIEHAQFVSEEDINKFKEYDVVASVQPIHFYTDAAGMVQKRVGEERMADGYRWKSLINAGAKVIGGSDFPIETHNPIEGIRTLITRIPLGADAPINPEEKLDLDEAVSVYTQNPRYALRSDTYRGKMELGFDADIIVLNKPFDVLLDNPNETIEVLAAFCAGKLVYKK